MGYINGVNLLPSTGEFAYDTIPYLGQRVTEPVLTSINRYAYGGPLAATGTTTDYSIALNNLQAEFLGCTTVALVVAWFGNSTDITACQIYPSTTYIGGTFQQAAGGPDVWRCSGLTQFSPGLIPIPSVSGTFIYGGTPSDQSIVRCIQDLKSRGLRVVFYPFILMTAAGEPWRGRITYDGTRRFERRDDRRQCLPRQRRDLAIHARTTTNLTVAYSGSSTDYTLPADDPALCQSLRGCRRRRSFLARIGISRRRRPSAVRPGPRPGTTGGDGRVTWDYPFVAGLSSSADDVRSVFDGAGLTKDTTGPAQSHHLFGRLVGLDGLSASGRKRPMAASRPALRPRQHRSRLLRQLSAAVGLDDGRRRPRRAELARSGAERRLAAESGDLQRSRHVRPADDPQQALI